MEMNELYLAIPEILKITTIISISIGILYCFYSMFLDKKDNCDDESISTKLLCFIPLSLPMIFSFWFILSFIPTGICYLIAFYS